MAIVTRASEENGDRPEWIVEFTDDEIAWLRRAGIAVDDWLESMIARTFAQHGQVFDKEPVILGQEWIDPMRGGGNA